MDVVLSIYIQENYVQILLPTNILRKFPEFRYYPIRCYRVFIFKTDVAWQKFQRIIKNPI